MKAKYEFAGIHTTNLYLTIYFEEVIGRVRRVREVRVPWHALVGTEVVDMIDRATRRQLLSVWSDEPLPPWDNH